MTDLVVDNPNRYAWIGYIRQRLRQNKNCLLLISGPTGSGKSWSGLAIGKMLDESFDESRVIFKGRELMKLINEGNLPKGSVLLWDEAGVDLSNRNFMSLTNKMLNYLLQTFRSKCFVLIFTTPYADFVDKATRKLFHAELRTLSIDFSKRMVKLKPQLIQYNSRMGKFYFKFLRLRTNKGVIPVASWSVPAPEQELIDKYEIKKNLFLNQLNLEIAEALESQDNKLTKSLTPIQEEIVESLQQGKLLPEIANSRSISLTDVYYHIHSIRKRGLKINAVKNDAGSIIYYEVESFK